METGWLAVWSEDYRKITDTLYLTSASLSAVWFLTGVDSQLGE
jgi:hypothetical protein